MTSSFAVCVSESFQTAERLNTRASSDRRFQVVYNYVPRNEDELELREGDVVDVVEKCDDGWFVGTTRYICLI